MAEDFLGAQAREHFCLGIELHAVAALVAQGRLAAQVEQAGADRVAVVALVLDGFNHLVDDDLVGHVGGVAHAEVDHVDAGAAFTVFEIVDLAEEVGRQPPDALGDIDLEGDLRGVRFALHESPVG